jgi:hypothetical protein
MRFFVAKKKKKTETTMRPSKNLCSCHGPLIHPVGNSPKKKIYLIPNEYGGVFAVNSQPGNATYAKNVRRKESRRITEANHKSNDE